MFRFTLRAASRRHVPSRLTQPLGRRGYASLQERAAHSSDRPWQLAALGVAVPGVLYLRKGSAPKPAIGHSEALSKPVEMTKQAAAKVETQFVGPPPPPPQPMKAEEATAKAAEAESAISSGVPTPSSAASSEQGGSPMELGGAEQNRGE